MSVGVGLSLRMAMIEGDCSRKPKQGLEQGMREHAYLFWENDGCPHGRAEEYWHRARDQHLRERAYVLWQQEGCPEGRAEEHWHQTCQFEILICLEAVQR